MERGDPFAELVDRAQVEGAAQARSRERWLRQQAEEGAELAGTLVDMAERGDVVGIRTVAGRRHQGTLAAVATDFVVVRSAAGESVSELKLDPPAYRTMPVPAPTDPVVWATRVNGTHPSSTQNETGPKRMGPVRYRRLQNSLLR